jgi:hypothetical protein
MFVYMQEVGVAEQTPIGAQDMSPAMMARL